MRISVITVNLNNALGLKKTIESVVAQSCQDYEFIIIDGGSTDGSIEVLRRYSNSITYWVSEPDKGIYNAMNKGLKKASCAYLMFLNSGDQLTNESSLEYCLSFINNNPGFDIYYGDMIAINHTKLPQGYYWKHPKKLDISFFRNDTINHQSSFIRKELFNEFGLYPENKKLASDYWLWLKCILNDKSFQHIEFPIVTYDFSGISGADNFEAYGSERNKIWNDVVPSQLQDLIQTYEHVIAENAKLKLHLNSRLISLVVRAQKFYVSILNYMKGS